MADKKYQKNDNFQAKGCPLLLRPPKKNVAILGSTGSIGINTLKVISSLAGEFRVVALSSFRNTELLAKQIERFKPFLVTVVDPAKAKALKKRIGTRGFKLFSTIEGLNLLASNKNVDIIVIAISGAAALYPLLASIEAGKHICLANKESIVMAGALIMQKAKKKNIRLIPVDSEHSAIFQSINSRDHSKINRIFLTGSGGPLFKVAKHKFASLKIKEVLRHPKWKMGKKITVDSATFMNKGLEIIEAKHLFDVPVDKINVLIHPEAVIHSMCEFIDGMIIAQLGITDMRLPIQYALTYPERVKNFLPGIDFSKVNRLNFYQPDMHKYPCLALAITAAKLEGTYPSVLNAANEIAVKAFLEERISFIKIPKIIEKVLLKHRSKEEGTLDDILQADIWARQEAAKLC